MLDYLLVFLSVVLLAISFMIQKLYQKSTAHIKDAAVNFNLAAAVITLTIFFISNGFKIAFTPYSVIMSLLRSLCGFIYSLLGFVILKRGNVSLYMLFLMSGGMLVPAVWGWLFLGETEKILLRIIGVAVIVCAIVISNLGAKRPDRMLLLLCTAVFFLNGFVSVTSKLHQINTKYEAVGTTDFVLITGLFSLISSVVMKIWYAVKDKEKHGTRQKIISFDRKFLLPLILVPIYSAIGGISSYLQLIGAENLPSSVLYPMITGGTVVLSGIFALICFGEKPSKGEWIGICLCLLGTCLFL